MPRFLLKKIDLIEGKQAFFKLYKDEKCEFDEFCNEIEQEGRYLSELKTAFAYLEMVANLKMLPKEKMRDLTPKNELVKEYEIKTKHLRIYFIHQKQKGKIIILGGFKNMQPKDIERFRVIKKQYLNTL